MTGCGIRGIRYALEVQGIDKIVLNDLNPSAYEIAKRNVKLNNVEDKVDTRCHDANVFLNIYGAPSKRFDIIDIDPFGTPSPYLESASRALKEGGLFAFTATDLAPLCGVSPIAGLRKYGGRPLRTEYCHEIGARLLVGSLISAAAKHELAVKILLCYYANHYIRAYATITHGIQKVNYCLKKIGYIAHCFSCLNREVIEKLSKIKTNCDVCGEKFSLAGPLWLGDLVDKNFCKLMLNDLEKRNFRYKAVTEKMLKNILIEKQEIPTFFIIDKICSKIKIKTLPVKKVIDSLNSREIENSITHFHKFGFKARANILEIESIFKELSSG